ncbi:hypothetical protein GQ600_27297 [Phytophthora cactorum]|nr:hypothetical protein GQ600_27297 [Phytophthora cactorum]
MAKARPAHLMAPKHVGAPLTTTSTSAARAGKASVEYVRLRREEQANMIVLSGAEKYARAQAQFEPVVEKLSGLSTVAFHQEMNKWKSVIECDVVPSDEETSLTDVGPTAIESDTDSDDFYQIDLADVMVEMEKDQKLTMEGDTLASFARERTVVTPERGDKEYLDSLCLCLSVSLSLSLSEGSDVKPTQTSENPQQMPDETEESLLYLKTRPRNKAKASRIE